jgi:hypothetical protein
MLQDADEQSGFVGIVHHPVIYSPTP